jgi:hypothetical protein
MAEHDYTQAKLAKELDISEQTLRRKLRTGKFDSDEMEKMIVLFDMQNPCEIFFANIGTSHVPSAI